MRDARIPLAFSSSAARRPMPHHRADAELGQDNAEGLILRRGDDEFGQADVPVYGLPAQSRPRVKGTLAEWHI